MGKLGEMADRSERWAIKMAEMAFRESTIVDFDAAAKAADFFTIASSLRARDGGEGL